MTAECCSSVLERVLSLRSRGLRSLFVDSNPFLSSHALPLIRIISNDNFLLQYFEICGSYSLEWEHGEEGLKGKCWDTLWSALKTNQQSETKTHEAALEMLKTARIFFLGSRAPSSSSLSVSNKPASRRHLLDLPHELLQLVLSFLVLGALSDRQIRSIVRHAVDRTELLPRIVELETAERQSLPRRTRALSHLDQEAFGRIPFQTKLEVLKDTGCDFYDR